MFDNTCDNSNQLSQIIHSYIIWVETCGKNGERASLLDMNRRSSRLQYPLRVRAIVNRGWIDIEKTKKHSSPISIVLISNVFHDFEEDIPGLAEYCAFREGIYFIRSYFRKYPLEAKDLLLKRFGTDSISSLHKECYQDLIEAIEDDLIKK